MTKKIISIILAISVVLAFSGCGLFPEKVPPTPRPTVDPNAPIYMNGVGVFTLYNIETEELEEGYQTVSSGGSKEYNVRTQVTLDMKNNKNNKIVFDIKDRFNPYKTIAEISYDGSRELITVDLSGLGLTSFKKHGFDLNAFLKTVDFASLTPPEFEDMLPDGVEIEIDFEKVDMMDYLMSILYSIDTTALVINEESIAKIAEENGTVFEAKEPFDITVGVYSKDNMFENMQVTYAKSGAKVANITFTELKFVEGEQVVDFKDYGINIEENDPFEIMKTAFEDIEIGEGFTIEYQLNNGYRVDDKGNILTIQNRLNLVKRSVTEMEVDVYQKVLGNGGYNHILSVTTFDFEEWKVTLKEGLAYVVANPTAEASIKTLIGYIDPFMVFSDDIRDALTAKSEAENTTVMESISSLYAGLAIAQTTENTEIKGSILAKEFNEMQSIILNELKDNGYDYNPTTENINNAITRKVMTKIAEDLKDVVNGSSTDTILGGIISGILGSQVGSGSIDAIYKELTKQVSGMLKSVLDGILPLPEIAEGSLTANFDVDGLKNIKLIGSNNKPDQENRHFNFTLTPNLTKTQNIA